MGRGGSSGGGSRGGGFSSGGSRGFSSGGGGGSRGGGSMGRGGGLGRGFGSGPGGGMRGGGPMGSFGGPGRRTPPPPRHMPPPPPPRYRRGWFFPVFGPRTVYVNSGGQRTEYTTAQSQREERRTGVPGWYKALCVIMVIVVIALLFSAARAQSTAAGTVTREKLGADACVSTDNVLDDKLGWITDTGTVKKGMTYFYNKTGVQPYLLICDSIEGKGADITDEEAEAFLEDLYDSLYSDEGHMIFVFMEYAESRYYTYLYTGVSADAVMDSDARGIFLDNADRYYTDRSLTDEEYFAKIFTTSADTIMADASGSARAAVIYVVLSVVILIVMAGGLILFKTAEKKRAEAEEMRKILNTPVGSTENSPEDEELINKYSKRNAD